MGPAVLLVEPVAPIAEVDPVAETLAGAGPASRDVERPAGHAPATSPATARPSAESGPQHRNNFDFLRCFLALLVIYCHAFPLAYGKEHLDPLGTLTQGRIDLGCLAVDGFFLISGYLVTQSWIRSSTAASYFQKRLLRIVPGYLAAVAICFLVVSPWGGSDLAGLFKMSNVVTVARRAATLGGYFDPSAFATNPFPGAVNGSLWTIRLEFVMYLLVPVLAGIAALRRRWWAALILAGLLLSRTAWGLVDPSVNHLLERTETTAMSLYRLVTMFLCGVVALQYREKLPKSGWAAAVIGVVFAVSLVVPPLTALVYPVALTLLLLCVAFHPKLRWHGFAKYGDFSYGIYLYAFPFQQLLVQAWPNIGAWPLFFVSVFPTVGAAAVSWHFLERRALQLKSRAPRKLEPASVLGEGQALARSVT